MQRKGRFLLAMLLCSGAQGADIVISGNWVRTLNESDLSAGAGSDLSTPVESSTSLASLAISNTGGAGWTIKVSRSDSNWPAGVSLSVRRTSDGSGSGSISGGTSYLPLSGSEQTLFTGSDDRTGIQLQLKTEGFSVQHAPDSYLTQINYSIQ